MRYNLGDSVKVKNKNQFGKVIQIESKRIISENETIEFNKYLIKAENTMHKWYFENELEFDLQLDSVVEEEIRKLLIDINLKHRNFEMVKMLTNDEQKC